jgi:glycosyltransferase involved in cell wall biosynthesis
MLVLAKESNDPAVIPFVVPLDLSARLRRQVRRIPLGRTFRAFWSRPLGSSYFSDDRSLHAADVLRQLPPTDVLHLHWLAGLIDYRDTFRQVPSALPVVWTLHDMNPFTGGCHFSDSCDRYTESCGSCPQLGSRSMNDYSAQIRKRKMRAYDALPLSRIRFVAPSHWLAGEARRSSLLRQASISVIPYALDTEIFKPENRERSRRDLGVPEGAKVLLFVADSVEEKRKGLALLLEAARGLAELRGLFVLMVGHGVQERDLPCSSRCLQFVSNPVQMARIYNCADVFAVPSLQDNLPNTALEALACGVPTVAFAVGGLIDIVRDGETGLLVHRGDVSALRAAIAHLLENPGRRASMSKASRMVALEEYRLEVQARRYLELYKEAAEESVQHGR